MRLVLLLVVLLVLFQCCRPLAPFTFQSFRFAENGVCIRPSLFSSNRDHNNNKRVVFTLRNVPGEGDCMFLAVALAAATSIGLGANSVLLRAISGETRAVIAQVLASDGNLYIDHGKIVSARQLLQSAAEKEKISTDTYLDWLKRPGSYLYGGGPELAVLSNVLRRPISVYEIDDTTTTTIAETAGADHDDDVCPIRCVGTFGDGMFNDPCKKIPNSAILSRIQPGAYSWHLHILVVNTSPTEKHACVLLPQFVS